MLYVPAVALNTKLLQPKKDNNIEYLKDKSRVLVMRLHCERIVVGYLSTFNSVVSPFMYSIFLYYSTM